MRIEAYKPYHFSLPGAELAYHLVASDAIKVATPGSDYELNIDIATDVLNRYSPPSLEPEVDNYSSHNPYVRLERMIPDAYNEMLGGFRRAGVVSTFMAQSARRFLRPRDIIVQSLEGALGYFNHIFNAFPETPNSEEGWAQIAIDPRVLYPDDLTSSLLNQGILTPPQAEWVNLRGIIGHEFGHAVDHALILAMLDSGSNTRVGPEWLRGSFKHALSTYHRLKLLNEVAPCPDIVDALSTQPQGPEEEDLADTMIERVSSGFEITALYQALGHFGVDINYLTSLVPDDLYVAKTPFADVAKVVKLAGKKGISANQLNWALRSLGMDLANATESFVPVAEDLKSNFFSPERFGYFFPLTRRELRKYNHYWRTHLNPA